MAHRSRLAGFIIDCETDDLAGAAAFWSAALGDGRLRKPQGRYVKLDDEAGAAALRRAAAAMHALETNLPTELQEAFGARPENEALRALVPV